MPRGGKRPGAGAPRGNLNALKSGRHSTQLRALADTLASIPEARSILISAARRHARHKRQASRIALSLFIPLLHHAKFNPSLPALKSPPSACSAEKFFQDNHTPNPKSEFNQSP